MSEIVRFHLIKNFALHERKMLKSFIVELFRREGKQLNAVDYIFCDDDYLLKVNQDFLQHDYYTDIITFDFSESKLITGEIYISIDRVKDNAKMLKQPFLVELQRVIFHGALHLCGYTDKDQVQRAEMTSKENEYLGLASTKFAR